MYICTDVCIIYSVDSVTERMVIYFFHYILTLVIYSYVAQSLSGFFLSSLPLSNCHIWNPFRLRGFNSCVPFFFFSSSNFAFAITALASLFDRITLRACIHTCFFFFLRNETVVSCHKYIL